MNRLYCMSHLLLAVAAGFSLLPPDSALAAEPSFDCTKVENNSIEQLICNNDGLAALDRQMAAVYNAASARATNEHPPVLKAEQRGWIKGRNECWKSDNRQHCIEENYRLRIAELQAHYRLVEISGEAVFQCNNNPADVVLATYFATAPPTLIAERGDSVSLMYLQPSGSGTRYQGRNESIWEHQGEAIITWGYGNPEMRCIIQQPD